MSRSNNRYNTYNPNPPPAPIFNSGSFFNTTQQYGTNNFDQVYAPSVNLINRYDDTNRGNVVHNNLGTNLQVEHICEYKLKINSGDRDLTINPSMFKQVINFEKAISTHKGFDNIKFVTIDSIIVPRSIAIDMTKVVIPSCSVSNSGTIINSSLCSSSIFPAGGIYNPTYQIIGDVSGTLIWTTTIPSGGLFSGYLQTSSITNAVGLVTGTIYIYKTHCGTSYGTLSGQISGISGILNGNFEGIIDGSGNISGDFNGNITMNLNSFSSQNQMATSWNHPYLLLKIEGLETNNNLGTSTSLSNNTFTFRYDTNLGNDMTIWKPVQSTTTVYKNSLLKSLASLTFILLDENGKEIKLVDTSGNNIIGNANGLCYINSNISNKFKGDYNAFVSTFKDFDPNVAYTNNVTQVMYNLTVGVIENELNTLTNFK